MRITPKVSNISLCALLWFNMLIIEKKEEIIGWGISKFFLYSSSSKGHLSLFFIFVSHKKLETLG